MKITKYKRRTFKDVAAEAYARGWNDGREQGRKDAQSTPAAVSLRKLAWSRITNFFKRGNNEL
jgi:flagellar biosynthesis/type III secretory pathway protein FliH